MTKTFEIPAKCVRLNYLAIFGDFSLRQIVFKYILFLKVKGYSTLNVRNIEISEPIRRKAQHLGKNTDFISRKRRLISLQSVL